VLGKLAERLALVVGLIACLLPIMALSGFLRGIDQVVSSFLRLLSSCGSS
jgi:hypothetical protein